MLANQKKKSSFSWSKSCLKEKNPHHARIFELRKNIISYGCSNIVISFLNFVLRLLLEWLLPTNSKFLVFHDHFFSDQTLEEEEMRNEITMFPEPYEGIFIFSSNASREEPTSLDRLRHMQLNYNRTNNGHPVDLLAPPGDWPASLPKKMEKKEEATQAVAWLLLLLLIGNHLLLRTTGYSKRLSLWIIMLSSRTKFVDLRFGISGRLGRVHHSFDLVLEGFVKSVWVRLNIIPQYVFGVILYQFSTKMIYTTSEVCWHNTHPMIDPRKIKMMGCRKW